MNKIVLFLSFLIILNVADAQMYRHANFGKSNGIYLEMQLGNYEFNTSFASINYEHYFGKYKTVSIRGGSYITQQAELLIPISMQYIANARKKHEFEVGFGAYYHLDFSDGIKGEMPGLLLPLAYRYQESDKVYIRIGINFVAGEYVEMKPFFSLGHRF